MSTVTEIYVLQSISGHGLPSFISRDTNREIDVMRGALVLDGSGRYKSTLVIRESGPDGITIRENQVTGVHHKRNNSLILRSSDGNETTLAVDGRVLRYWSNSGKEYLYAKATVQE